MWMRLLLEGEIVRNPSVSLSLTLSRNKKVEQYIRKKYSQTHNLKILGWRWCQSLCGCDSCLIFHLHLNLFNLSLSLMMHMG